MAMTLPGRTDADEPEIMVEINTTPLIDVMLVLLIMLIITIPIQTHAVKLDMPAGPPPQAAPLPEVVSLAIAADGTLEWNGQRLAGPEELEARLKTAATGTQPELHVHPDRRTAYRHVAMALATAQRNGIGKIGVVGADRFPDDTP